MSVRPAALLPALRDVAARAATAILEVYGGAFAVQEKADHSPLTAADMAAHRQIVAGLHALTPDWPVLSEEGAGIAWAERRRWRRYWLVDPLDGTREFVKRNGEFTVNIALIEAGQPVIGIVQAPVTGAIWEAARGAGAWYRSGAAAAPRRLSTSAPQTPLRVAGSRSHARPEQEARLARLGACRVMPLGSSLKFCRVAEGGADLYLRLGPTSEWDTAAGQCVLREAGGAVLRLDGTPLDYNAKESLLNPSFIAVGDPRVDWAARLGAAALALAPEPGR